MNAYLHFVNITHSLTSFSPLQLNPEFRVNVLFVMTHILYKGKSKLNYLRMYMHCTCMVIKERKTRTLTTSRIGTVICDIHVYTTRLSASQSWYKEQ